MDINWISWELMRFNGDIIGIYDVMDMLGNNGYKMVLSRDAHSNLIFGVF